MAAMILQIARLLAPFLLFSLAACQATVKRAPDSSPVAGEVRVVNLAQLQTLAEIMPALSQKRVVFVAEVHVQLAHHQNQLRVIRRLYARHPDMAIGLEWFQQPFQPALDDFVAGRIDESTMLRRTQYFRRWGYDYRLYAPILRFARRHRIPLVALNLPSEITRQVGAAGLGSLSAQQRAQIPTHIDRSDVAYRQRLRDVFAHHPHAGKADFERFYDVQLLWDEGMAARAAHYLKQHPARRMVILAGDGHVRYGSGIPARLARRLPLTQAIVLNGAGGGIAPAAGDYLLLSSPQQLPPPGRLGVVLTRDAGGVRLTQIEPGGAAQASGLRVGDDLIRLNGRAVRTPSDVRIVLWNKRPGDAMEVVVRRGDSIHASATVTAHIRLR